MDFFTCPGPRPDKNLHDTLLPRTKRTGPTRVVGGRLRALGNRAKLAIHEATDEKNGIVARLVLTPARDGWTIC